MVSIERYHSERQSQVADLNRRIAERGMPFRFPAAPKPALPGCKISKDYFLATEEDAVRGGYVSKRQGFLLNNEETEIGNYQLPISEGLVEKQFAGVAVQMLMHCLRRTPLCYTLGMGGVDTPLAKLLKAAQWRLTSVPFFFWVEKPVAFLRNVRVVRSNLRNRVLMDVAASSGIGSLLLRGLHFFRGRSVLLRDARQASAFVVDRFESWADDIWSLAQAADYRFVGLRDSEALNEIWGDVSRSLGGKPVKTLYGDSSRFVRLKVQNRGEAVGWAIVTKTKMKDHQHFGDMTVGSIVDCLARPGAELAVVYGATRYLREHDSDLIVSNQLHSAWQEAFRRSGYFLGPSNFIFATAPKLTAAIGDDVGKCHMNRGDGDGPLNL